MLISVEQSRNVQFPTVTKLVWKTTPTEKQYIHETSQNLKIIECMVRYCCLASCLLNLFWKLGATTSKQRSARILKIQKFLPSVRNCNAAAGSEHQKAFADLYYMVPFLDIIFSATNFQNHLIRFTFIEWYKNTSPLLLRGFQSTDWYCRMRRSSQLLF